MNHQPDKSRSHHRFDYVEIMVTDMARAKDFYQRAFGWTFTDYAPEYCGFSLDGDEFGGIYAVDPSCAAITSGSTLVILYSQDLESTKSQILAAGGQITLDSFTFPGGERFEFADPFGNKFAVWTTR